MVISTTDQELNQSKNKEQKLGYVYRHIRLDTNMPFYIGVSSVNNGKYERAFYEHNRNPYWNNIANLDNKKNYRVEILMKNLPLDIMYEKEKYFIKLYGRKDKGLGTLVNMTDGGDKGTLGIIVSEEKRLEIGRFHKGNKYNLGRTHTSETKKKLREANLCKKVGQYKDDILIKEYPSVNSTKLDGFHIGHVSACCQGRYNQHKGFHWKFI